MTVWNRIVGRLTEGSPTEWIGFIVLVVGIAGAAWCIARFRASLQDDAGHEEADFLLAKHVRELHERGDVTSEEFRSLKARINRKADGIGEPPSDRSSVGQHRGPAPE